MTISATMERNLSQETTPPIPGPTATRALDLDRIVLTGFMGSGKTTTGGLLAERLGWRFLDLDREIERRDGRTVAAIFAEDGEDYFRRLETTSVASLLGERHLVLALGGGTPEDPGNRVLLEQVPDTAIVYLAAPLEVMIERCRREATPRPLLDEADTLFSHRRQVYERIATHTVETSKIDARQAASAILAALEQSRAKRQTLHRIETCNASCRRLTLATQPQTAVGTSRVRGHIVFVFAMLLLLATAWKLRTVLELVYVSALFAVVLMPIVQRIMKLKIRGWSPSRPIAIAILIVGAAALLTLFFILGLPPVVRDMQHFAEDLPSRIPGMVAKIKHLPMADKFGIDSMATKAQGMAASTAQYLFSSAPLWISHILDVVTAFILCLYFMLEGDHAYGYFLSLVPADGHERLAKTLVVAELKMSKWLIGQGSLMLILGVASTIAFGLLHVRYFVLLGVLMGLFNIIPVAGGVITILLAGGVAAIDSWEKMAGVFLFYAIYVQLENGFLTPRIMKSSVDLMGLTVLIALLIGTEIAGVVGALVAVPTAALITVLMDEYLVQKDAKHQQAKQT